MLTCTYMFADWLMSELKSRSWTQSELSRRSGISQSQISQLISSGRNPGVDTCTGIANAFGLPVGEVMRQAGLQVPKSGDSSAVSEIAERARKMSPEMQDVLLRITRSLPTDHN